MYSIVRTLPARTRLLLVGDPYQLPPIGFGLIFHVIATSTHIPRVELLEVHRQMGSSGIPQIGRDIRHGVVPLLPALSGLVVGVSFIDARKYEIMDCLLRVLTKWSRCDDVQVLGVTKHGANGMRNINATLHRIIPAATRKRLEGWAFAEGDPVIYLVNDYGRELWNGSLGTIESIFNGSDGRPALLCTLEGAKHEIAEEDFLPAGIRGATPKTKRWTRKYLADLKQLNPVSFEIV